MKLLLKTTIIIIFSLSSHAQSVSERLNHLYLEVTTPEKYKNADTKNILVEVNTLLEDKELAPTQRMQALLIATNLYKLNGERCMAIETAENAQKEAEKENLYLWQAKFLSFLSSEYKTLNMLERGHVKLSKAIEVAQKAPKTDELFRFNKNAYKEMALYAVSNNNYLEAISYMQTSTDWAKKIQDIDQKTYSIASNYQYIGSLYIELNNPDSALYYLNSASRLVNDSKQLNAKILLNYIYTLKGEVYFKKKNYTDTQKHYYLALNSPTEYRTTLINSELYKNMVDYYIEVGNVDSLRYYKKKVDSVAQIISNCNAKTINSVTKELDNSQQEQSHTLIYYLISTLALVSIIGWVFYQKRTKKKRMTTPKVGQNIESESVKNNALQISSTTQQRILEHIKTFEENQEYLNPKISATLLANQFETNTKYITHILRETYGKDFTTYINELRINHITQLLEEEPKYRQYKISYLAEIGGYSSHSKFTAMFKKVKDCSPSEFINNLE